MKIPSLAVALDTSDWAEFESWCAFFGSRVQTLKVGLEAYVRWGPAAVDCASQTGAEIFLDLKLHDIPNTVAGAVGSARELGVRYLTVHCGGGARMLEAAVDAGGDDLAILGVTVLTHLDARELDAIGLPGAIPERVMDWARLAHDTGCGGVVSSPLEVGTLRARLPRPFRLVTPGIRLAPSDSADDQRRVATPAGTLRAGSDLLVVGRPLTRATDRAAALETFAAEVEKGLGSSS